LSQNLDNYIQNLNTASVLYLSQKEIPKSVLLDLVPKNDKEFSLYYETTYPEHKLAETDFFNRTTIMIFNQVINHRNEDFYLPSLNLISFADGEFGEIFIEYLQKIIDIDQRKFCISISQKEYSKSNPIKHYSELNGCK